MPASRLDCADIGQRVYAYRNLTRGCWSVKALDGAQKGRVIGHYDALTLTDCAAAVQASGVRWVRANGKRLVCGGIVGTLAAKHGAPCGERITFRPFTDDGFTWAHNGAPWARSARVVFTLSGAFSA